MLSSLEILNPHENVTINSPILQVHKLRHREVSMRQPVELGVQPRSTAPEVTLLALTLCASLAGKLWVTSSNPPPQLHTWATSASCSPHLGASVAASVKRGP